MLLPHIAETHDNKPICSPYYKIPCLTYFLLKTLVHVELSIVFTWRHRINLRHVGARHVFQSLLYANTIQIYNSFQFTIEKS